MAKHTATPWVATDNKWSTTIRAMGVTPKPIAEIWNNGDDRMANAEFIVRAVNAHDELIEALQAIVERSNIDPLGTGKVTDMRRIAADALAKHGGAS